jgi:hypothetical protein
MQPYNPEWQDMSDYVVHFTKATPNNTAYDNIMSILWNRVLYANPFGIARRSAPNIDTQACVCFSEAPLHLLERIAQKRGGYGIGFTKRFILENGGGPIWYVERGESADKAVRALIRQAIQSPNPIINPIWELTPFIDSRGGTYQYEWEREWRYLGNLNFTEQDTAFLIIPEEFHESARSFFEQVLEDNSGPSYLCPFIEIGWSQEKVRSALEEQKDEKEN